MTINYSTRAAIADLPGKKIKPWRDGDGRCHCTHCDLCGDLYRTSDISKHEIECQAALLLVLDRASAPEVLRDRFAMAALQGEIASEHEGWAISEKADGTTREQQLAERAYRVADAMLSVRKAVTA